MGDCGTEIAMILHQMALKTANRFHEMSSSATRCFFLQVSGYRKFSSIVCHSDQSNNLECCIQAQIMHWRSTQAVRPNSISRYDHLRHCKITDPKRDLQFPNAQPYSPVSPRHPLTRVAPQKCMLFLRRSCMQNETGAAASSTTKMRGKNRVFTYAVRTISMGSKVLDGGPTSMHDRWRVANDCVFADWRSSNACGSWD